MKTIPTFALASLLTAGAAAQPLPESSPWPDERSVAILEATREIRLAPDLTHLRPGERIALARLLEVGGIMQDLYEDQKHPEALDTKLRLEARAGTPEIDRLRTLYRLFSGPIAITLDNRREPFWPVADVQPGKNVYPWGTRRGDLETFLEANPGSAGSLLDLRAVVRRADDASIRRDLEALRRHPALATLHPGLQQGVKSLTMRRDGSTFYAVPYSVAWSDALIRAHDLLREAAIAVAPEDEDFAQFLENRARDLLSDDYESGDAAWVTGQFHNLNAQIGSYEVYDDELMGVKTFFSASILVRNREASEQLRKAIAGLQELEDSLPYEHHKKVRDDIPVGIYDVIADFGQARGINTATILPNESHLARKYGRTILLRGNIMRHPELFGGSAEAWKAAMAEPFEDDLAPDGNFHRTLWHEIGHYLGVSRDRRGRELEIALQDSSSTFEEMKADLVSLYLAPALRERGHYDDAQLRSVYASGIRRVLQNNRPRPDQPYQTMQLMQWNWFLDRGLLTFDRESGELSIDYSRYHDAVASLLREVLGIQWSGDKAAADRFIAAHTSWRDDLHEVIARRIRDAQRYRYTLVRYAALGE
ncbi:MAG TPA: NUDIX hydrolase [Thermoanaerobaculia bacterium]|nr:NUDIX hydrolase [Thermoanaerobaculia bacterium]